MDWFVRQTLEQIEMGDWYDGYVKETHEERKYSLIEALNLADEKEMTRKKNESGDFLLDCGGLQCVEFMNLLS
jgi:hypothetical protein